MANIKITENILQDGYWAYGSTSLSMEEILPILQELDTVGYHSLEAWGGRTYEDCIALLNEDPWERLRRIKQELRLTPLQLTINVGSLLGYREFADDVVRFFIESAVKNGGDILRLYDPLNNILNVETAFKTAKHQECHIQGGICYAKTKLHSSSYYVAYAKQLQKEGAHSLAILDTAGLLMPYEAYELVRDIRLATKLPIFVQSCNKSNMADMVYLKSAEAGAEGLVTTLSPFAGKYSAPSTEKIIAVFEDTPYDTRVQRHQTNIAREYFAELRVKHTAERKINPLLLNIAIGTSNHQLSAGMIVSLLYQLEKAGNLAYLEQILQEVEAIRTEAGFPVLMSPIAEIIASQAVINVLSGKRYETISREFRNFVRGRYGRTPAVMDVAFRQAIIGEERQRIDRPANWLPPDMERLQEELPEKYSTQPEDLLTLALFPELAIPFFKKRLKENNLLQELELEKKESSIPAVDVEIPKKAEELV